MDMSVAGEGLSSHVRAQWVKGLLIAGIALAALSLVSGLLQQDLLSRAARGLVISAEEASANDLRQGGIAVLQFAVLIATAVAWLMWLYRAYGNLLHFGTRTTAYSPGWSVGEWFLPFFNLVRAYQIMKELWL